MINHYIILSLTFLGTTSPHLNPQGPIYERNAVNCLKELAVNQFKSVNPKTFQEYNTSVELLTIVTTGNLTSPAYEIQQNVIKTLNILSSFNIEVVEDDRNDFGVEMETRFYLFVVDSVMNFERKLEILSKLDTHDPSALILVYYSHRERFHKRKVTTILEKLWGKSMTNAAVLYPKTFKDLVLYTLNFNLKTGQKCISSSGLVVLDNCIEGSFRTKTKYYQNKLLRDFNNCTLDVIANAIDPFVITTGEGFEIAIIKQIGETLNIFFNITLSGEDSWGMKENGWWSNGLGSIYNDSCLGVGNFYALPEYMKDFDFTVPHFVSDLVWVVPIAQYVPKWRVLTIIFDWHMWLLCVCVIFFGAALLKMAAFENDESAFYKSFGNDFLVVLQVVLMVSVNQKPIADRSRLVFASLCLFGIIITSVYTSLLINYLTRPQREHQVDSIEDVLERGYDIGGFPVFLDIFNVTDDEKSMRIYENFQVNESLNAWLTSVADDKDTCTIGTDFFIKYKIAQRNPILTDGSGKPKVHIIGKKIFSYSVSVVTKRGFPFLDRLDNVIAMMTTFGLAQEMAHRYLHELEKVEAANQDEGSVQKLTPDHLQGAFVILVLGYVLGIGIFLIEILKRPFVGNLKRLLKMRMRMKQKKKKIQKLLRSVKNCFITVWLQFVNSMRLPNYAKQKIKEKINQKP